MYVCVWHTAASQISRVHIPLSDLISSYLISSTALVVGLFIVLRVRFIHVRANKYWLLIYLLI